VSRDGPRPAEPPTAGSFADLYRDAYGDMVRLAYLLTGSREVARDVVQDAFVRMHGAFDRARDPHAYLRRVVVNECHSYHRRRLRQRHHLRSLRLEVVDLNADEVSDVLATLPYRQRAAIVLRYWHGANEAEIATLLRCRPGTVGSLLHRAIAELRKVIEP